MVLQTRREDSATNPNTGISTSRINSIVEPKASSAKEVLLTLKPQLQARLESGSGDREMHAGTHANTQGNSRTVRPLLDQVDSALSRIDQGKHGICSDCSVPIEGYRMVVEPYSTRCTGCQAVADWRGLGY
jgi:RNA polymerase-binding transcription factor DksA